LQETVERDALIAKKSRKQRQKEAQVLAKPKGALESVPVEEDLGEEELNDEVTLNLDAFEPIDLDDIRGAW